MPKDDKERNGVINGRAWRLVETLIIAFIIGGITMWGTSQRVDEKLKGIEQTLIRFETLISTTANALTQHLIISAQQGKARESREIERDVRDIARDKKK